MIKSIILSGIGAFVGVIVGAFLGALWLIKSIDETRSSDYKPNFRSMHRNYKFDLPTFATRSEAEGVLRGLRDIISAFDEATVGDVYESCGEKSRFPDRDYGWRNLADAEVIKRNDRFILRLPRPIYLRS